MASTPPQKPASDQRRISVGQAAVNTRRFLVYGFGLSLLFHLLIGPLVPFKQAHHEEEKIEEVSIKKLTKAATPKPTPTPKPEITPTPPPPKETPPPKLTTPEPERQKLKVNLQKTTSNSGSGPAEATRDTTQGSENGVPQGTADKGSTAPPATPAPATPTPAPTATPGPKCAVPNADATTVEKAEADYPDIARQMGATGTAQIQVSLSETGKVLGVTVYKSTNNKALDKAAMDAARSSKFKAEVKDCTPTAGSYLFTVVFENQ